MPRLMRSYASSRRELSLLFAHAVDPLCMIDTGPDDDAVVTLRCLLSAQATAAHAQLQSLWLFFYAAVMPPARAPTTITFVIVK